MSSLTFVALFGLLGTLASAQMTYYFISSSYIKAGKPYEIEVNIHRPLPEPLVVDFMLKLNNSYITRESSRYYIPDTIVFQKMVTITEQGTTTVVLEAPSTLYDLNDQHNTMTSLEISCTGAFEAFHSEELTVQDNAYSTYVQSDKAMYKPGDLVRFRTFATDSDLKPYMGHFDISIKDPDRNTLKIWRNVEADTGVISKTFQLSDQPPLGRWIIEVENKEAGTDYTYEFQVKEYVLPKFKVTVKMPSFLLHISDELNAIVEAKYTFGQPVKGNASIAIGMKADGYRCRNPWEKNRYSCRNVDPCKRKKILTELDKDGKYDIRIPMDEIVALMPYTVCNYRGESCSLTRDHLQYKEFVVLVNVTEAATGITLSGEGQIRITGRPVTTDFLPATPLHYKPGLPFIGYIQLTQPDGTPIPEQDLIKPNGARRSVELTITRPCSFNNPPYYQTLFRGRPGEPGKRPSGPPGGRPGGPPGGQPGGPPVGRPDGRPGEPGTLETEQPALQEAETTASPEDLGMNGTTTTPELTRGHPGEPGEPGTLETEQPALQEAETTASPEDLGMNGTTTTPELTRGHPGEPGEPGTLETEQPVLQEAETTASPEELGVTGTTPESTTEVPCGTREIRRIEVSPGGVMAFEIPPISKTVRNVELKAEFVDKYYVTSEDYWYITPFITRSKQGLRVLTEMEDGALKPGSTAIFTASAGEDIRRLRIDIIAKGEIVYSKDKIYDTPAKSQNFSLEIDEDFARTLAPSPRIVVWYAREDGEIIADSVSFNVDSELANQVRVEFSRNETRPGEGINVTVEAYRGSTIGLMVVDQSVKLLASGNDITKDKVEANLRRLNPNTPYYPWAQGGRWGTLCGGCLPIQMPGSDTSELLNSAGYIIFTDGLVYKQRHATWRCGSAGPGGPAGPAGPTGPAGEAGEAGERGQAGTSGNSLQPVDRIRDDFPESWIWLDAAVGPDGRITHQATAPDTITSWVASAFAISKDKGLGLSLPDKMTVFKPFFVSLTLPYALIRGEQFGMKASVFNYLSQPQDVTVTLAKSIYYDVLLNGREVSRKAQQTVKIPASDAQTVVFWIIPTKVGNMNITVTAQSSQAADGLTRMIPIRPEGTPQEHTESMLISLAQGSGPFIKVLKPTFPPKRLVRDSQRVKVTVMGDIMGPVMNNLNSLVRMPYGCGEQNMVNFVPNILVLSYINASGANMPELEEKARTYIESGYQRELTYRRYDGSFSVFGNRDAYGSTWLTAFVLKSFAQAVPYMEVNKKHIESAIRFLLKRQSTHGGYFIQPGRTASYLMGGSGTRFNMVAYITIALATARDAHYEDMDFRNKVKKMVEVPLMRATRFLENKTDNISDPYSMAITAYAFAVTNNTQAEATLDKLNKMAIEKNGMRYWSDKEEEEEDMNRPWWYYRTRSYEIEMTSYALLANLHFVDIDKTLPILKWLISKRNPYGGYSSTQDTVMALQALTKFATKATKGVNEQNMHVSVSADIQDLEFDPITSENSMVTQIREIPQSVNSLTVMGNGSGTSMVQMIINYNILDPDVSKDIDIKVDSRQDEMNGKVMVNVCFKWLNKGENSGMGIVEITPLSGYEIDTETLHNDYKEIKRTERNGQTLVTYWDKFEEELTCLNVTLFKTVDVTNVQHAEVKIYSYYQTEKSQTVLYLPLNMKSVDPCVVCPECCKKDGTEVIEDKDETDHDNK